MVEPLLSGIVLGLVPITILGLIVTAYLQYRRGDSLNFQEFQDFAFLIKLINPFLTRLEFNITVVKRRNKKALQTKINVFKLIKINQSLKKRDSFINQ